MITYSGSKTLQNIFVKYFTVGPKNTYLYSCVHCTVGSKLKILEITLVHFTCLHSTKTVQPFQQKFTAG